jgi:hypothetical protein
MIMALPRKTLTAIAEELETTPEFLVDALLRQVNGAKPTDRALLYSLFDQINAGLGFETTVGSSLEQAIKDTYYGVSADIVRKALQKAGAKQ